ncbi:tigger transposable element-derived protein 4-like [Aphis gossypii]|uniref:tigger transposable element-derived protein 4-like n=1 Tax=Aphis gossypii TaxID=80765 RepID=UPI002159B378|nr:tigger transposable element-derived protein 4-like [Aphis gossypii]
MSNKRSLKCLNVGDKLKIIKEVEKGVKRKKDIAADFNIPANTLSSILKNKDKIVKNIEDSSCSPQRKKLKVSNFPQIEDAMLKWIHKARDHNLPVSGPLIQEKAKEFAQELGLEFHGSSGWLHKFKMRNGIISKIISGESAAVSETDCNDYVTNILPGLIQNYSEQDIFNFDELGLFFKCLPDRTLTFKGKPCHGGKKSKERITVLLGANMAGTEKSKLLVIGKYQKPRCFKNVKSLPVQYEFNKKAWMTSQIYEAFLHKMDKKFLQPMDQGVIKNLKHHYRKKIMQRHLRKLELNEAITDVNLLDCIHMLYSSWEAVSTSTISNCFRKAGFRKPEFNKEGDVVEEVFEDIPEEWLEYQRKHSDINISYQEFLDIDSTLSTSESLTDAEIFKTSDILNEPETDSADEAIDEEEIAVVKPFIRGAQAENYVHELRRYVQKQSGVSDKIFSALNILDKKTIDLSW